MERMKKLKEDMNLPEKEKLLKEKSNFKDQLKFIEKFIKWHFSINESTFQRNNIISQLNFIFKRVTLSPDCKKIARLDYDRTFSIYNLEDLENPILQIKGKLIDGNNIRFSYNSERIAFYDERHKEINVWDICSQEIKYVYKETPDVVAFAKTGDVIGIIILDVIKFYSQDVILSETTEIKNASILEFANPSSESSESSYWVCIVSEYDFYLWDFQKSEILYKYAGDPEARISCCRFNFTNDKIVAGTAGKQILIWKVETKKTNNIDNPKKSCVTYFIETKPLFKMSEHTTDVVSVMISQDEKNIISYEVIKAIPRILIWEINKNRDSYNQIADFKINSSVSSEAFYDNKLIIAGYDHYLMKYDLGDKFQESNKEILFGKRNNLMAYSLSNELVAKSLNINLVHILKIVFNNKTKQKTSTPFKQIELKKNPLAIAFSPDNFELALSFKDNFQIYNLDKLDQPKYESFEGKNIHKINYLSKKTILTGNKEGTIMFWNALGDNFKPIQFPKNHESSITLMSINEQMDTFASSDSKGRICLWDIKERKLLGQIYNPTEEKEDFDIINIKFYKSKKKCIVGNSKCVFFYWDTNLLEKDDQFVVPMSAEYIEYNDDDDNSLSIVKASDFDLSPDEKKLVISFFDGRIALWNSEKNEMMRVCNFFSYQTKKDRAGIKINFKTNDTIIAKAKECIKEMNIEPEVDEFTNINSMKLITNDGKLICLKEDTMNEITVYDSVTGKSCYEEDLKIKTGDVQEEIQSCFLSIDHKLLLGYNSKKYSVWKLMNGELVYENKYQNKKGFYIAYDKKLGETALIVDATSGYIFSWKKGINDPLNIKNKAPIENKQIIEAIQSITNIDISFDDSKVLIEYDNQRILIINRQKFLKEESFNINNEANVIYLSKFAAKPHNNVYSVMIKDNSYQIVEWDGITGKKLRSIVSNQQIIKIIVEPQLNNLLILSSNNYLELFSPENENFIRLTEFEEGKLENFFLNKKNDLFLRYKNKTIKKDTNEIDENEEETKGEIVQIYYNFYKNSKFFMGKKKKLECIFQANQISILNQSYALTRMFPLNYNFLQIMAYDRHCCSSEDKIFEIFSDKKLTISFELFFSKDLHGRNCFDIAFFNKDSKLFKDFLEYIMNNYEITKIPLKYRQAFDSNFFLRMFLMFEDNIIINKFLNFVFSAPSDFPIGYMHQKLTKPILETYDEPSLSAEKLKKLLKEKGRSNKEKLNELVLAKCFYPHEFLDYERESTKKIFKIVSNFDPANPIFGNLAIINILEYKWNSYAKMAYFKETLYFFIFLALYVLNADYFFVTRMQNQNSDDQSGFIIGSIILDLIIYIFIIRLVFQEIKQLYNLGCKDYFSSFWNYNDICYIGFSFISTTLDFLMCMDLFTNTAILKCFQSLAIFFSFFRLLSYARGIEESSFMIKLLIEVIFDIRYFLLIMIVFIFSLSFSSIKFIINYDCFYFQSFFFK